MILLVGLNLTVSSQNTTSNPPKHFVTYVQDTKYQCMVVPLTDILIVGYRQNEINSDEVLNLNSEIDELRKRNEYLEKELEASKNSSAAKDSTSAALEEQVGLHEEQNKKRFWKDVGDWFKDKWEWVTGVTAAAGVGFGVGYATK